MENINLKDFDIQSLGEMMITYGSKVLLALITLLVGLWVIKRMVRAVNRIFEARDLDPSLRPFLSTLVSIGLKILLAITVVSMLGVEMTSFVAILGAAGLAVGLALQGTLQNFAGGVIILILKPFRAGDVLEAQGYTGVVKEIQIFNTILNTFDNRVIIIPNGALANSSMINYSKEGTRRVDWTFGIAYGDSSDTAKEVLLDLLKQDPRVLEDPAPLIAISSLGDSSVNFVVRAWVKPEDYWDVFFEMNEKVYKTFPAKGLNIPFPQMDVHLKQ